MVDSLQQVSGTAQDYKSIASDVRLALVRELSNLVTISTYSQAPPTPQHSTQGM